ncbi:MAG: DUF983 domain-containing protein [Pirellulales bacterium]|nr:DUF983 domain-containing protein [Pirellulales bacterium]
MEPRGMLHKPSLATLFWRALRLRCPVCGEGQLFRGWFRMHERCAACKFQFNRGPGYWLGSIYVNYGLTALIVTTSYFAMYFADALPQTAILWLLTAFCVAFPLWFFRYARSIWIGFDLYVDPRQADEVKLDSVLQSK